MQSKTTTFKIKTFVLYETKTLLKSPRPEL